MKYACKMAVKFKVQNTNISELIDINVAKREHILLLSEEYLGYYHNC